MKEVVAGVDIGGTNTVFGLVDKSGNVYEEKRIKTPDYPDFKEFVTVLASEIEKLVAGEKDISLAAIGIGAPNANYHKGTIEFAPNLAWKGVVSLGESMRKKINVPVAVTNDANAAAIGEMMFGGAKGMKDFIVLTLGTGLGSGIVINGEVVYGHTGFAGELGHTILVQGGRACGCGLHGCYETYGSASGLVRTVLLKLSEMRDPSPLREILPSQLTSKIIVEAAEKSDKVALAAIDHMAENLALGIANAIGFSSPEAVFLFGGLAKAGELLFAPTRRYVDKFVFPIFKGTYKILPSGVNESNAAVLGAAALAWKELEK